MISASPLTEDSVETMIINGTEIEIEDAPYQVSLQVLGKHLCGGSIIGERFILTAGHYIHYRAFWIRVRVGSTKSDSGGELIQVKRTIKHPKYDSETIDYDFALLELEKPIEFNEKKQIAKLIGKDEMVEDGTVCRISGWGKTLNPSKPRTKLRMAEVPIVAQEKCKRAYGQESITPRMICASDDGNKDSCKVSLYFVESC